ncbi:MAG: o-succinylbenzoate synthase [Calditrichaeota bacterium]|nr:MAG: o-succinylbenzoate synthase [Calditrichota bacterium]
MRAEFRKFTLRFITPMGTSRGVMTERETYILRLTREGTNGPEIGLGECAPLNGLSVDHRPDFEDRLRQVCEHMNQGGSADDLDLQAWPAIRFGVESALLDLARGGRQRLFDSPFTRGERAIPINGLVVMGSIEEMLRQVVEKAQAGFTCIKIKVGALDFDAECELLRDVRKRCPSSRFELRLDANGAFAPEAALARLERLAAFGVHSLEQPIKAGQRAALAEICRHSPIPVALDEELIGIAMPEEKLALLEEARPQYIVLKPTLVGGLAAAEEWIRFAQRLGIGYWVTSALESNIGLNVLSQWTSTLEPKMPQGLGTGRLFVKNFPSPLNVADGHLHFHPQASTPDAARELALL